MMGVECALPNQEIVGKLGKLPKKEAKSMYNRYSEQAERNTNALSWIKEDAPPAKIKRRRSRNLSPADKAEIVRMNEAGFTARQTADKVGISINTVRKWLHLN